MNAAIRASTHDYVFATWREIFLTVWCDKTTVEGVQEGRRIFAEHLKANPSGVLVLTIVDERAPMPDGEARDALGELLKSGAKQTKKSAVVFEGAGFRAAAVRSVVTGITVFSRPPFPHKIFGTVDEATQFLEGEGMTAAQLAGVIADVRKRHSAGSAP